MIKSDVKSLSLTQELRWRLVDWSIGEVIGIPGVAVECVDIWKNIESEGRFLDGY